MSCDKCGAPVSVNEFGVCAYCERMTQALYALLRRNGGKK